MKISIETNKHVREAIEARDREWRTALQDSWFKRAQKMEEVALNEKRKESEENSSQERLIQTCAASK